MLKNAKSSKYIRKGRKLNYKRKTGNRTMPKTEKTIRTIVKKEIASNLENKVTGMVTTSNSILSIDVSGGTPTYNYLVFSPVASNVLMINQGVDVASRIGNRIKLKRFVIKGTVYFDPNAGLSGAGNIGFCQNQGYVDLYFGRPVNVANFIDNQLTGLYQNGNNVITPTAQIQERTYSINKDQYKVLWHKRYKIGSAGLQFSNSSPSNTYFTGNINNNDYKLNVEFGFDACKLCCKNRIVRYDDNSSVPQDAMLDSLTLWGTFTCPNTDPVLTGITDETLYCPVRTIISSYVEYEDA